MRIFHFRNLIFFAALLITAELWAIPEVAVVRAEKTIVYADQFRKIPLGTLSRGKILRVAETSVKVDSLFPITVSGKLAYVPIEDLYEPIDVEEEWYRRYYISKNLDEAYLYRRWLREGYASIGSGLSHIGGDLPGMAASSQGVSSSNSISIPVSLKMSWRMDQDFGWTLGSEFSYWSEGTWNFKQILTSGYLDLFIWDSHRSSLIWGNGLVLSPYGQLNFYRPEGASSDRSWAWGWESYLRLHWRWERLFGPFLEASYQHLRLQGLSDSFPGRNQLQAEGPKFLLGLFFAWD